VLLENPQAALSVGPWKLLRAQTALLASISPNQGSALACIALNKSTKLRWAAALAWIARCVQAAPTKSISRV
jgi:hypothetical protein